MRTALLAFALFFASAAHGQGMIPYYTFTQSIAFNGGNATFLVAENVSGYTNCTPMNCDGAMHYVTMRATVGSTDNVLYTPDFLPTNTITYDQSAAGNVPITDAKANLHAEVNCTIRGPAFVTDYPQTISNDNWETQITFFQAYTGQSYILPDCQFSGDTHPDWNPVLNNPVGTPQSNPPYPLYLQGIQLAYSPSSQPAQGHWVGFPYDNPHNYGGQTGDYGILGWTHSNGNPGPMPHICTQNQIGLTTYNPAWTPNPQ